MCVQGLERTNICIRSKYTKNNYQNHKIIKSWNYKIIQLQYTDQYT